MSTQQVFNVCVSLSLRLMTFQHIFLSWEFVRKVFQFDVSCAACRLASCSWQHSALVLDQGFLGHSPPLHRFERRLHSCLLIVAILFIFVRDLFLSFSFTLRYLAPRSLSVGGCCFGRRSFAAASVSNSLNPLLLNSSKFCTF